jgi:hypothetical protein
LSIPHPHIGNKTLGVTGLAGSRLTDRDLPHRRVQLGDVGIEQRQVLLSVEVY